jgi:glycosyltransferase involved in cell wall biosynthesis
MKVALHAGQLLQPVPGGVGRYVRALIRHLPRSDIEVAAFGAGPRPNNLTDPVEWTNIGWPHGSLRYEAWHRLRAPRPNVAGDLVHAPSLAVPPRRDRPLIVTVHDVAFLRFPEVTTRRGEHFHRRALQLARRDADLVLAPSAFTRAELVEEGFDADRIRIAPLGVDPPARMLDYDLDAILYALGLDQPFVLTVGTVEPRKNLSTLIDAMQVVRHHHPDLVLAVVGPTGWGRVQLDRPGVRRLGQLPWIAVDALYRRAAACAVVSHYEGFGLPALEALARGAPLVCSEGSALGEVVGDSALRVDQRDPHAIASAIERALDDDTLRATLRRRGVRRAGELTWERCAVAHARVYNEVMAAHS